MTLIGSMAWAAGAIAVVMLVTWIISLVIEDVSIVDIAWGLGIVIVAWMVAIGLDDPPARSMILVAMTTVWGLRLAGYLAWRNLGEPEDRRYRAMRRRHGDRFPAISLFTVFLFQGAIMWTVSLPVQAGQHLGAPLGPIDALGVAVFAIGLFFESVGDLQLARFKADPGNEGEVLDRGLWRYTRHPNYFGDFLVWWGLYLVALSGGAWWTAVGPVVMTVFLVKVSGVGLLEQTIGYRRPGYDEYVLRTNAFFPGPPRASSSGS